MSSNMSDNSIFNMREGVFTKEKGNIGGLPSIADIELHRSDDTGHFYLKFIEWFSGWNEGRWQCQEIPEDSARIIMSFLYPDHITECYKVYFGKSKET